MSVTDFTLIHEYIIHRVANDLDELHTQTEHSRGMIIEDAIDYLMNTVQLEYSNVREQMSDREYNEELVKEIWFRAYTNVVRQLREINEE